MSKFDMMPPSPTKEGGGEQNESNREQGVPIAPEARQELKLENNQSEPSKEPDETVMSEAAPSGPAETIEKPAEPEISQKMKEQVATIVGQLEKEAVEMENVGEEALAKAPSPEKKARVGKLGKALSLLLLTLSIHGATAMYSKAEAGDHRYQSNPAEIILKGAAVGVALGVAVGLSTTLQRCLPQSERPVYVQQRIRYAKTEDAVKYERQRDQIFSQYLRMKAKDPVGAEYFLRDSMNALNNTYERY